MVQGSEIDANVSLLSSCVLLPKRGFLCILFQPHEYLLDAAMAHPRAAKASKQEAQPLLLDTLNGTLGQIWGLRNMKDPLPLLSPLPGNVPPMYYCTRPVMPFYLRKAEIQPFPMGFSEPARDISGWNDQSWILALALEHGLKVYLALKLQHFNIRKHPTRNISVSAINLLAFAMLEDTLDPDYPGYVDVLGMLLESGGDPNQPVNRWLAFQRLLLSSYRKRKTHLHTRQTAGYDFSWGFWESGIATCVHLAKGGRP